MDTNAARLPFASEGDHLRCVEYPDLVIQRGGRYRVGERIFGSLDAALLLKYLD